MFTYRSPEKLAPDFKSSLFRSMILEKNMEDFVIMAVNDKVVIQSVSIINKAKISIQDLKGNILKYEWIKNSNFKTISIEHPGNYKVTLEIEGSVITKKIIIK